MICRFGKEGNRWGLRMKKFDEGVGGILRESYR
jgi:hypothetical protein